jgi:hypothetical protein
MMHKESLGALPPNPRSLPLTGIPAGDEREGRTAAAARSSVSTQPQGSHSCLPTGHFYLGEIADISILV